jgi:hypothetical protein
MSPTCPIPALQVTTVRWLLLWAGVKLAMVPLLFACIFMPRLTGGDVTAAVAVAAFWVLSGAPCRTVRMRAYKAAPGGPARVRAKLRDEGPAWGVSPCLPRRELVRFCHVGRAGYLNTCSYLVAPSLVPPGQKPRASVLMTVAFQVKGPGLRRVSFAVHRHAAERIAGA